MKLPPGPKTPSWLIPLQFNADPFGYMDAISKRYGDIVTLMSGSAPTVYVSNPLGIKEIFTSTKEISASGKLNRGFALMTGKQGVLQLDGIRHKHRRKLLMPAFHGARMQTHGQRICDLTQKVMQQQAIGKPFIGYPTMEDITVRVSIEVVMGLSEGERHNRLKQLLSLALKQMSSPSLKIAQNLPFGGRDLGRWSPQGYLLYLRQELFNLLYIEVQERRKQTQDLGTDILSELVLAKDEAGNLLTSEEVRDLLISPLFAAQDASSTALAWSLYWIHRFPHVRDRLLKEIDSLGENPDPMSIFALPYLSAVCNEILRIYPTQLFTFPRLVESTIKVMGYELNPGTILVANIYSTHQREDVYPHPKEFQPERFLEKQYSSYEFLPFGGGSRVCIGGTFALFEMKLVLATILSHYELELVSNRPERPKFGGLISYPASGVKMIVRSLRQRKGQSQPSVVGSV
ncbi:MAG: cytochrome P450 [Richelia sp. RM2_1_2]|nr:cytochrome P450 [Richelia sp. SM1_7_0]NJN12842.1 cytochrome P450 [Richelia sp. RM1_1_1]NJO62743.1 cytochrome P450 [Richelia sp. RM2_1_2]